MFLLYLNTRPLSGPKPPSSENYAGGQGGRVGPLVGSRGNAPRSRRVFLYLTLKNSILLGAKRAHEHKENFLSNPLINAFFFKIHMTKKKLTVKINYCLNARNERNKCTVIILHLKFY